MSGRGKQAEVTRQNTSWGADAAKIEAFLGLPSPDQRFRQWLDYLLEDYSVDVEVAIEKVRWTKVADRVEHMGKLARQIVDKAAELEALVASLNEHDLSTPMERVTEGIAVREEVRKQGVNPDALEKQLKPFREAMEYLRFLPEAQDQRADVRVLLRLKAEHRRLLKRGDQGLDITAAVAQAQAEAPLAAAALLRRPKHPGGTPPANWNWNKMMTAVVEFYNATIGRTERLGKNPLTWSTEATPTKDPVTHTHSGHFFDFATLIDCMAAKWVTGAEPTDRKTLGSRLERVLSGRNKN
jgi:hypothetical protein